MINSDFQRNLPLKRIDVAIAISMFIVLRMKDPGFVPYDAIFFTDQDQVPAKRYFE